jgi:hypothetical protein
MNDNGLPRIALSVRQPWAWAIIHGGKDVENRSAAAVRHGLKTRRGRIAIHAAKGMTKHEYAAARDFMQRKIGIDCPEPADLLRGGIIGSVEVVDVVKKHTSPWFFGLYGLVLKDPKPCKFIPAIGKLGYFEWEPADRSIVPPPAKWMRPVAKKPDPKQPDQMDWLS